MARWLMIVARFVPERKPGPLQEIAHLQLFKSAPGVGLGRALNALRLTGPLRPILVERGAAMIATRSETGFVCARRDFHDQWQRCPFRGRLPAPTQRLGAIYQGFILRESERAVVAGASTDPAANQHSDQCGRQQPRRTRI